MNTLTLNGTLLSPSDPFTFWSFEQIAPPHSTTPFDWTWDLSLTDPGAVPFSCGFLSEGPCSSQAEVLLKLTDTPIEGDWSGIFPSPLTTPGQESGVTHLLYTNSSPLPFIFHTYAFLWEPALPNAQIESLSSPIPEASTWLLLSLGLLLVPFFPRTIPLFRKAPMTRSDAEELIVREFGLAARDFRRTPGAVCWARLEETMHALQWIKLAKDSEAASILEHLPEEISPILLCQTIADFQRREFASAAVELAMAESNRKPARKRAKEKQT